MGIAGHEIASIIPAYKVTIPEIEALLARLPKILGIPLIAYNDSDLELRRFLRRLESKGFIRLFNIPYQVGKIEIMKQGINHLLSISDADVIVQTDVHLKQQPEEIINLVECLLETGLGMVVANRYGYQSLAEQEHRRSASMCLSQIVEKLTGYQLKDTVWGTRSYTRELGVMFTHLNSFGYGLEMEQILIAAVNGFSVGECPVQSNRQADATNAEKIEDNLYALIGYCDSLKVSTLIMSTLCFMLAKIKQRVSFDIGMSPFNVDGIITFKYVGSGGEHINAYTSGFATDGYSLLFKHED